MKEIINVTEITDYLYCPRKIFLKRIKKIKEPPTKAMILGFLKHKVFDIFNKNESIIVSSIKENLSKEQILVLYNNYLKAIIREISRSYESLLKSFKIETLTLENQTFDFLRKDLLIRTESVKNSLLKGYLGKELWRNLKPKYLTEFQITSYRLGLKGRIDRIKIEDKILPYEIKTRTDIYEQDKIQLAAYSLLLEEEFGRKIEKGKIETNEREKEVLITDELKNKVLEIADKIRNMKNVKNVPFPSNFNKCKSCRLRKECFEL